MRFFRTIKKDNEIQENNQIEEKVINDEMDFTSVMFLDIAEMKLKLENIKSEEEIYGQLQSLIEDFEKYIQKSTEVIEERKIEEKLQRIKESNMILKIDPNPEIPQSIRDRANQELTIEEYYRNIKEIYNVKYKKATQAILIRKLEKFNTDLDTSILFADKLYSINIDELKTYFEILKAKKEEFTGIMQNKYIERLIELEYKVYMIETIKNVVQNHYIHDYVANEFIKKAKATSGRQIIWSRLLVKEIQDFIEKANDQYSKELKKELEKINLQDKKEEIINSNLLVKFIASTVEMIKEESEKRRREKYEKQRLEKEEENRKQEEAKRIKEEKERQEAEKELEQFKNLTSKEIQDKIKEIDDEKFDIVTSYKNIMEYQIKVAKAKGLISERDILGIDDIDIQRISKQKIPTVLENLKDAICNCEIYTDIDDTNENVYIVVPKQLKQDLSVPEYKQMNSRYNGHIESYEVTEDFLGIFSKYYTMNEKNVYIDKNKNMIRYFEIHKEIIKSEIKRIKKQWEDKNKDNVNKIKFYIEMPYRRTIIPVLEELNKNNIEFTIPPTDKKTKMNNPTVKIYMNREDLKKYKEQVHTNISNSEKGIVRIGEENIDIGELLVDGCEFEFLKSKNQEKIKE